MAVESHRDATLRVLHGGNVRGIMQVIVHQRKLSYYQDVMKAVRALILALFACLGAAHAQAQDTETPAIIVEDERPRDEAALTDLARELAGHPSERRPLARFEQPVCLVVASSDGEFARAVAERVIDNAKRAKVPVRGSGCKPNALVAFSDDARAQLQDIRDSGRKLFAGLNRRELNEALAGRDPAYVFQASEDKAASGQDFYRALPESPPVNFTTGTGRLSRITREDMLSAMVVVDNAAIAGMSAVQIADYVSLRLLAPTGEVDAKEAGAPRTIMTLFAAPASAPPAMTRFDRAYLKALYRMPAGAFASEVPRAAVLDVKRMSDDPEDQAGSAGK